MSANPFDALGRPIPSEGRESAYRFLRETCRMDSGPAWELVGKVSRALEDDQPARAQRTGLEMMDSDLTGYFRLAATLLASVEPT